MTPAGPIGAAALPLQRAGTGVPMKTTDDQWLAVCFETRGAGQFLARVEWKVADAAPGCREESPAA